MTKPGYTHIIVPKELHAILKKEAEARGMSIAAYIASELHRLRTIESLVIESGSINTTARNTVTPKSNGKAQNHEIIHAGGRIRTREPLREQILSLPPLSTR
jgi:hypothetical protein